MVLALIILAIVIYVKLLGLAFRIAWGIGKVVFTLVLAPLAFIICIAGGLLYFAVPILAVLGLIALMDGKFKA